MLRTGGIFACGCMARQIVALCPAPQQYLVIVVWAPERWRQGNRTPVGGKGHVATLNVMPEPATH